MTMSSDTRETGAVPIAELLRRRKQQVTSSTEVKQSIRTEEKQDAEQSASSVDVDVDIEEEIKRLEQELAAQSSPSSDYSDSDSDEDDDEETTCLSKGGGGQSDDANDAAVLCLSAVADERIVPLPATALPFNKRRYLKIDVPSEGAAKKIRNEEKDAKSRRSNASVEGNTTIDAQSGKSEGLLAAVKELLDGYVARSSERIPFYCRVCQIQSANEEEFMAHKHTDLHKLAVKEEQKASYCKVCRKQLTSVVQLKEHLSSKPHRERMDYVISKQGGMNPSRNGGTINGSSRGRGQQFNHHDRQSKRQWC